MKFLWKRKNAKEATPSCACNCGCDTDQTTEAKSECCGKTVDGVCCVAVLGAGCPNCHRQYEYAVEAVKTMGLSVEVEYVTDLKKVAEYGVMSMPALVVNQKVVSSGKILKPAEIEKLFNKLGFLSSD